MHKTLEVSGVALMAALLTVLPAAALDINIGGGNLLGGGSNGGAATVDTGLGNNAGDDVDARINLGNGTLGSGSDPTTVDVDLFGAGNQPTTANVTLGGTGDGTDANVLLDLFGNGAGAADTANARVSLGNGGPGAGGSDAALDIFGPDDGSGAGAPGDDGTGNGGSGGAGMPGSARTVGTVQLAAVGNAPAAGKCFTPTTEQQAKLVARHDYSQTTVGWGEASQLKVVDVGLCGAAGAAITGNGNIAELQSYVSAHPEILAGLGKLGRSADEVIAGDKSGDTLTLYVM